MSIISNNIMMVSCDCLLHYDNAINTKLYSEVQLTTAAVMLALHRPHWRKRPSLSSKLLRSTNLISHHKVTRILVLVICVCIRHTLYSHFQTKYIKAIQHPKCIHNAIENVYTSISPLQSVYVFSARAQSLTNFRKHILGFIYQI